MQLVGQRVGFDVVAVVEIQAVEVVQVGVGRPAVLDDAAHLLADDGERELTGGYSVRVTTSAKVRGAVVEDGQGDEGEGSEWRVQDCRQRC